jgi:hypothetical protein
LFIRKIKGVSVLNMVEALGIVPGDKGNGDTVDRILALWGADPVHPTSATYHILANKTGYKAETLLLEQERTLKETWVASVPSTRLTSGLSGSPVPSPLPLHAKRTDITSQQRGGRDNPGHHWPRGDGWLGASKLVSESLLVMDMFFLFTGAALYALSSVLLISNKF